MFCITQSYCMNTFNIIILMRHSFKVVAKNVYMLLPCIWYKISNYLRGCSHGSELARWTGGLLYLGEISPFLRNSFKRLSVSIWEVRQPAWVGSHLILPGFHLGEMKICHMNMCRWAIPARWDRVFFKTHAYVLEFFPNSISKWLRRVLTDT